MSGESDVGDVYLHFGPGVPMPVTADRAVADRAAAIWRGEQEPGREPEDPALAARRRNQRWILPLTVLILVLAVVAYFLFGRGGSPVAVLGARVSIASPALGCGGTERLTGTVETNGEAGIVTYQWVRSDGTASARLRQAADRGVRHVTVTLDWDFEGDGTLRATATLRVLSPGEASASASFTYACPGTTTG